MFRCTILVMDTSPRLRFAWTLLAVGCLGCAPVRQEVTLDQVCVFGNPTQGAVTFPENVPLRVYVSESPLRTCRSDCSTVVESRCTVTREGNTFRVSARLVVDVDCGGRIPPPVCANGTVECVTEPVGAGEYVVTDGTRSVTVRVPSTAGRFGKLCSS